MSKLFFLFAILTLSSSVFAQWDVDCGCDIETDAGYDRPYYNPYPHARPRPRPHYRPYERPYRTTQFLWTRGGSCAEFTLSNVYIGPADYNECRRSEGSYYGWTRGGTCAEFTTNTNVYIQSVDADLCRYQY